MIMKLMKGGYYLCIILSVLTTFYYVDLYNKLLDEVRSISTILEKK